MSAHFENLKLSLHLLEDQYATIADQFCKEVASRNPSMKSLVAEFDPEEQGRELVIGLMLFLHRSKATGLRDSWFVALGSQLRSLGFTHEHIPILGNALLEVMAAAHGTSWLPPLERCWKTALELAEQMATRGMLMSESREASSPQ